MTKLKGAFLTFEKFHGRKDIGSSRIRAQWVMKNWPDEIGEVEDYVQGKDYDFIVYQKVYWPIHAKLFQGVKILDICDADWYDWEHAFVEMVQYMDAVTVSTEAIKTDLDKIIQGMVIHGDIEKAIPVVVIKDRMDSEFHTSKKTDHKDKVEWAVWFGYSHNFRALEPVVPYLQEKGIKLCVVSDRPFNRAEKNYPWTIETVNRDLIEHDIILNPKLDFGKWKYKSDNKSITGWALGMPVAETVDEFEALQSKEAREKIAKEKLKVVEKEYNPKKSALEYAQIILSVLSDRAEQQPQEIQ